MRIRKKTRRLLASAALLAVAAWAASSWLPFGRGTVVVSIPTGSSAGEAARILKSRGVIRSSTAFLITVRLADAGARLKPGAYRMHLPMTPGQVLHQIANGETEARWVTFPEGYTAEQMGMLLEKKGLGHASRFMEIVGSGEDSMEGYLFPDTYLIAADSDEEAVVRQMRQCFRDKVEEPLADSIAESGMTLKQVIVLASLIEREAKAPGDRPLVSAVLLNRLGKGMRLQCDATVLYALGEHRDRVYYKDLEVDSPYNTYRYSGLPPGPIANPGLACIKAALNPAKVDYLYYVARADGSHIFSRTAEEHKQAIRLVRRRGAS